MHKMSALDLYISRPTQIQSYINMCSSVLQFSIKQKPPLNWPLQSPLTWPQQASLTWPRSGSRWQRWPIIVRHHHTVHHSRTRLHRLCRLPPSQLLLLLLLLLLFAKKLRCDGIVCSLRLCSKRDQGSPNNPPILILLNFIDI